MKTIRYYLFCLLHFMHYNLQPAINEEEREEFMSKFYENETIY